MRGQGLIVHHFLFVQYHRQIVGAVSTDPESGCFAAIAIRKYDPDADLTAFGRLIASKEMPVNTVTAMKYALTVYACGVRGSIYDDIGHDRIAEAQSTSALVFSLHLKNIGYDTGMTADEHIERLLSRRVEGSGFPTVGTTPDIDMTSMAIQALAPYKKDPVIAAAIATVLGVILGSFAALRRNTLLDRIIMVITTAFVSMPSFIMGSLLLVAFAVRTHIFPANGSTPAGLVLPVITLMLYPMSYITRLTRSSMLDVLGQDYIRTAKAKGVSRTNIIFKHALKNALIPVITYLGPELAYITTGSLVVEQIFAVPGIGRAFVNSITNRDYTLIMGTTIVLATFIVIMNLVSDIMYKVVDPRINLE